MKAKNKYVIKDKKKLFDRTNCKNWIEFGDMIGIKKYTVYNYQYHLGWPESKVMYIVMHYLDQDFELMDEIFKIKKEKK